MRIFTLNVNGFRGIEINNSKISDETRIANLGKFKEFIINLQLGPTDVIVLQEIPHMIYIKSQGFVDYDKLYREFKECFSKECFSDKYKIIEPIHLKPSKQCTVAICSKNSKWKEINKDKIIYDKKHSYGNKLIELEYSDRYEKITLLGLHMNVQTNKMWDMILASETENKHTFIVGDFNAYENRGEMQNYPQKLSECGFRSLISSSIITNFRYKSSIDNIYVHSSYDFNQGILIKVEHLTDFETDHALCFIDFTRP